MTMCNLNLNLNDLKCTTPTKCEHFVDTLPSILLALHANIMPCCPADSHTDAPDTLDLHGIELTCELRPLLGNLHGITLTCELRPLIRWSLVSISLHKTNKKCVCFKLFS